MMKFSVPLACGLALLAASALSDTLELADGALLEGDFVGSSNGIVMFNTGSEIEAYPESEVVAIYLSDGVQTMELESSVSREVAATVTVPSGTRLVIRISEGIDSRRHSAGHRFRGQLEGALVIDGVTAAPRGTMVHGRIVQAGQAGRMAGSSELAIEFTDIMIEDQLYEIATSGLKAQSGNEAKKTVGRTARAAVIGGLINGSRGAKDGAKVGVGVSILTGGSSINVPAGTMVETNLRVPLIVPQ
ncbi:hypothetical protein N8198_06330 [Gammaproteobacteria bacterium]|nr:hypothetical protein [Gammaproteobacteria bacterium]